MTQKFAFRLFMILGPAALCSVLAFRLYSSVHAPTHAASGDYRIRKVVLDAGHGGKDPGCLGAHSKEKDNALAIVLGVGQLINANFPDVQVIYTRKTDVFVNLYERAAIANRNNADLFMSVHCNALSVSTAAGAETYVMGLHTAKHNLEVAKRENASIYLEDNYQKNYGGYDPNSSEAHILGSMWQSTYLEQSIILAGFVQRYAKNMAQRNDRGVKQAGFIVLKETAMPSVLIETGYLTNNDEEDFLASENGQSAMSLSIFNAFKSYKAQMEGSGATTPTKNTTAKSPTPAAPKTQPTKAPVPRPRSEASIEEVVPYEAKNTHQQTGFRIMLFAWPQRMDVNSGQLALLSDVHEERHDGKYAYFTGNFTTREEAEHTLPELRNLGFKTAKVVNN